RYSHRQFDAITEQFSKIGTGYGHPMVVGEYEQGYDWMHQGEGYLFFYLLNLADPADERNVRRSQKYAGFLMNEGLPDGCANYDYDSKAFKCCYIGSMGAGKRFFDKRPWSWADWKDWYGLPYYDIPGIKTIEDIKQSPNALKMAEAMCERLSESDTVVNLSATAMIMNAYLHTGEAKYKDWISGYAGAWREQTRLNGGIIPDNRGPSGAFGEKMAGKWYGGYYGWTWPHGFASMSDPIAIACECETLLERDAGNMDLLRSQFQLLSQKAVMQNGTLYFPAKYAEPGRVQEYFMLEGRFLEDSRQKTTDNPKYKRLLEKEGWYEFAPFTSKASVTHLWFVTREKRDMDFLESIRDGSNRDWENLNAGYSKYLGGNDQTWINYLSGGLPGYPEQIMGHGLKQVYGRLKDIFEDKQPASEYGDYYLQMRNPVSVEGLVQLTMGGPHPLYNGGLALVSVIYYDAAAKRPGLPPDVAALVSRINGEGIELTLVNLHPAAPRSLIVQAGAFGEHEFESAEIISGGLIGGAAGQPVNDKFLLIDLRPAGIIRLWLKMKRYANVPAYQRPF
ncbi:MAG: hypothetical protein FWF03_05835, partial [Defluviitaleaceae bacterium]|nr:hypothetical protein [Defluviitaleaceae bacterium]